jgi:FAD:protein FMN transferase
MMAKGYAVDKIAEILIQKQITNYLLDFSGNIRLQGRPAQKPKWNVKVKYSNSTSSNTLTPKPGTYLSMASSGYETEHYSENYQWHHLINPITLRPAQNTFKGKSVFQTTVIGPDAVVCDILSTATFVAGPVESNKFMAKHYPDYQVIFLTDPNAK